MDNKLWLCNNKVTTDPIAVCLNYLGPMNLGNVSKDVCFN